MARLIEKLEDETERAHHESKKLHKNLKTRALAHEEHSIFVFVLLV